MRFAASGFAVILSTATVILPDHPSSATSGARRPASSSAGPTAAASTGSGRKQRPPPCRPLPHQSLRQRLRSILSTPEPALTNGATPSHTSICTFPKGRPAFASASSSRTCSSKARSITSSSTATSPPSSATSTTRRTSPTKCRLRFPRLPGRRHNSTQEFERTRGGLLLFELPRDYNNRYFWLLQDDRLTFGDLTRADNRKNNIYTKIGYQYGTQFDERMNAIVGESRGRISPSSPRSARSARRNSASPPPSPNRRKYRPAITSTPRSKPKRFAASTSPPPRSSSPALHGGLFLTRTRSTADPLGRRRPRHLRRCHRPDRALQHPPLRDVRPRRTRRDERRHANNAGRARTRSTRPTNTSSPSSGTETSVPGCCTGTHVWHRLPRCRNGGLRLSRTVQSQTSSSMQVSGRR